MTEVPILSIIPPISGNSKRFYSPELFDSITGDYPKASPPSTITYPTDGSGHIQYFEGHETQGGGEQGTIQVSISGVPHHDYWAGTCMILKASDRSQVASVEFLLSQKYWFRPLNTWPYHMISEVAYTDSIMGDYHMEGGGDQHSMDLDPGDYIVRFLSIYGYDRILEGPPDTYESTEYTSIPIMENAVTVIGGERASTSMSFT